MFSNGMIAFLAGLGGGAWVYAKMQRQTGGNTQNSLVVAAGAGIIIFMIILVVLSIFFQA